MTCKDFSQCQKEKMEKARQKVCVIFSGFVREGSKKKNHSSKFRIKLFFPLDALPLKNIKPEKCYLKSIFFSFPSFGGALPQCSGAVVYAEGCLSLTHSWIKIWVSTSESEWTISISILKLIRKNLNIKKSFIKIKFLKSFRNWATSWEKDGKESLVSVQRIADSERSNF